MASFKPYHIVHTDLSESSEIPSEGLQYSPVYQVFWWKNIAIGDLFIEENTNLSSVGEHGRLVMKAIQPFLDFIQRDTQNRENWRNILDFYYTAQKIKDERLPTVSVVICTRNRTEALKKCLLSLREQTMKAHEVIVVDNAPSDRSTELMVKEFPEVSYLVEPRPGLDYARNTGARYANSAIVAYTDDDVELRPNWLEEISLSFARYNPDALTGLIITASLSTLARYRFERYWTFNRGYVAKHYDSTFFQAHVSEGVPVWEIGAGANMAFKREVFEKIGYFDERLDAGASGCSGDSEIWYRILAAGLSIRYEPKAIAFHHHREDMKGYKRQIFNYMRGFTSAILLQWKNHGHEGNVKHLRFLIRYYPKLIYMSLKNRDSGRISTILNEIMGIISGFIYYHKQKNNPANS
ncbi:MAG: glycosyltransferase [Cyclobacteriaceae bacterium]|nr:glycosyltransferase [Cyclobacteriaceae bacterium]